MPAISLGAWETYGGYRGEDVARECLYRAFDSEERRATLIKLNKIASERGQTLAQMALVWVLRLPGVTSALIGASSVHQIEENVAALKNMSFSEAELARIAELI